MEILKQIQGDLIRDDVPLSSILRKARVLASQLRSDDLQVWASQELDGYKRGNELPDYRILRTGCIGTCSNVGFIVTNHAVPLNRIKNDQLVELITTYRVFDGIRRIERFATQSQHFMIPTDLTAMVNSYFEKDGFGYVSIELALGPQDFDQLLDTVKNRLQDFVLTLDQNWHAGDQPPTKDELKQLVSVTIYNHQQGGDMSVFDQRNQNVNYQYNAAGNINIDASMNKNEIADQLEKLIGEIERAKELEAINQDVAIEAEYHLMQATKEARKENPDRSSFLDHIDKTKGALKAVTATTDLVTALFKIGELASKIFS